MCAVDIALAAARDPDLAASRGLPGQKTAEVRAPVLAQALMGEAGGELGARAHPEIAGDPPQVRLDTELSAAPVASGSVASARAIDRPLPGPATDPRQASLPEAAGPVATLCNLGATPPGTMGDDAGSPKSENGANQPFSLPLHPSGSSSKLRVAGSSPVSRFGPEL